MAQDNVPGPVRPGQRPSAAQENALRQSVRALVNMSGPASVAGDSIAIHLGNANRVVPTRFAEVISYAVIVADARWRYLVQPGTYSAEDGLAQTDPAFDSCWTLGPESGRIYVTNSVEQHNTSGLLTGGEGADMTVEGAWTKERRPLGVGDVVPLFWTGAIWMIFQPNNIATGCG